MNRIRVPLHIKIEYMPKAWMDNDEWELGISINGDLRKSGMISLPAKDQKDLTVNQLLRYIKEEIEKECFSYE